MTTERSVAQQYLDSIAKEAEARAEELKKLREERMTEIEELCKARVERIKAQIETESE